MAQPAFDQAAADTIRALSSYSKPSLWKSCFQLLNTFVPFVLLWALMWLSLSYSYWVTLLLAIPTSLFVVRLFIIQHDCGHGSFFRSRRANNTVGFFLGVLTLIPYDYWRKSHAIHHASHGDLERRGWGDIDTRTVKEYLALSPGRRRLYRILRSPVALLVIGPVYQFLIKHRLPLDAPREWKREWKSVHLTNLGFALVLLVMWATIGLGAFVQIQLPVFLLSGSIGIWLFYVQHQFEGAYWEQTENWSFHSAAMLGSSYYDLPPILHWLTGNIGVHHIHHLCCHIPNYNLQRCMKENPELQDVPRLTLWTSLRCLRLKLWDEDQNKLVSFSEIRQTRLGAPTAASHR